MPELIDGQWVIRRSEVATYKRCPHAWYRMYVEGYRHPDVENPEDNRTQGTWWHSILQAGLEATIGGPLDARAGLRYLAAANGRLEELRETWGQLPPWMDTSTIAEWWTNVAQRYLGEVLFCEQTLYAYPPDTWSLLPGDYWPGLAVQGTIDYLALDKQGNLLVGEHKTSQSGGNELSLDVVYAADEQIDCYHMLVRSAMGQQVVGQRVPYASLVDVTRKVDPARARVALVTVTQQPRAATAGALYLAALLRLVLPNMVRLVQENDPEAAMRIWNPLPWMRCFCPGDLEVACAAAKRGDDVVYQLKRMFPMSERK